MSSKVLSGAEAAPAQPIVWPTARPEERRPPGSRDPAAYPEVALEQFQARLAELEQEARQREQQAFESGQRQGRTVGAEEAATRLEPVLERLGRAVEELIEQRRRVRREAEEDLVKLAVAIARRVLHRELSIDPEALLGVVEAALKRLEAREVHRLRVHPTCAAMVAKRLEQLGRSEKIQVLAEAGLEPGAVLFDTTRGSLDASLETQLQEIQRGLSDRIQARR